MSRLLQSIVLVFALVAASSLQALDMDPNGYLKLAAMSPRAVVVDVESVKISTLESKGGVAFREVVITGKRIETIRGDDAGAEFRHREEDAEMVDEAEARKSQSKMLIEVLKDREELTGRASLCKEGHRYLVIDLGNIMTIFVEVPKDDDAWMKQLLKLRELQDERKKEAEGGKDGC